MENGTGVQKIWYETGPLMGEVPFVNGVLHGEQRCFDESGELITSDFWLEGKKVSKRRYEATSG
jgi:antitoxin component YwqK of YwqJK toxin-antitoxin module